MGNSSKDAYAYFRKLLDEREKKIEEQEMRWKEDVLYVEEHVAHYPSGHTLVIDKRDPVAAPFKQKFINPNIVTEMQNCTLRSNILTENQELEPYHTFIMRKHRDHILVKVPFLVRSGMTVQDLAFYHDGEEIVTDSNLFKDKMLNAGSNIFMVRPSATSSGLTLLISSNSMLLKSRISFSKNSREVYRDNKLGGLIKGSGSKDYNSKILKLCAQGFKDDSSGDNRSKVIMPILPMPSLHKIFDLYNLYLNLDDISYNANDEKGKGNFSVFFFGKYKNYPVGIKRIKDAGEGLKSLDAISKELIIQAMLTHENILPLIGVTVDQNHPLIVLPWVNGGSMDNFIKSKDCLTDYELYSISKQFAMALGHLVDKGVVHRDLGARNLLVNVDPDEEEYPLKILLCDFGLASCISSHKLTSGAFRFLPPETYINGGYTFASDVYGFGLTMLEILAQGEEPLKKKFRTLADLKSFYEDNKPKVFDVKASISVDIRDYTEIPADFKLLLDRCLELCSAKRWKIKDDILPYLNRTYAIALKGRKIELRATMSGDESNYEVRGQGGSHYFQ